MCVPCCTEHCNDTCQTISLGAISGCWGFNKLLLFSLNFREHFSMSSIYKNKATTHKTVTTWSFEMFYILTCLLVTWVFIICPNSELHGQDLCILLYVSSYLNFNQRKKKINGKET